MPAPDNLACCVTCCNNGITGSKDIGSTEIDPVILEVDLCNHTAGNDLLIIVPGFPKDFSAVDITRPLPTVTFHSGELVCTRLCYHIAVGQIVRQIPGIKNL